MHNVRPILTGHNTAKDKKYQRDPALESYKKIFLRKMNKTGLQDNYMGTFNVIVRSEKYLTIRLNNGKIDNVTEERVKPCFSSDALPCPAMEEQHEVNFPALPAAPAPPVPPAPPTPPAPPIPPAPPEPPAPPAPQEPYRTRYGRIGRKPDRFTFHTREDHRHISQTSPEKGGDVAHATWHFSSCRSQEQQHLLTALQMFYWTHPFMQHLALQPPSGSSSHNLHPSARSHLSVILSALTIFYVYLQTSLALTFTL